MSGKNISVNGEVKLGTYTDMNGDSVDFNFVYRPSLRGKIDFVKSLTGTIVGEDYLYVARDVFFDFHLIDIFTDVDTSWAFIEDDGVDVISNIEKFVRDTNIADIVKENMGRVIVAELEKSVELDIEYRTGIHSNPVAESLGNLLDTIERKVDGFDLESMMDVAQKLSDITGSLTPEKMLEAYANTDMFKANRGERNKPAVKVIKKK